MNETLQQLRQRALAVIEQAGDLAALEQARIDLLGKKSELSGVMKQMGRLDAQQRRELGAMANELRSELETLLEDKKKAVAAAVLEQRLREERIDVTAPGRAPETGRSAPPAPGARRNQGDFCGHGLRDRGRARRWRYDLLQL